MMFQRFYSPDDAGGGAAGAGAGAGGDASAVNFQELIQPDGALIEGWQTKAGLPEELANSPTIQNTRSFVSALSQLHNAQKMTGFDKIPIPAQDSDDAVWDNVFGRLGRPDKPEGYEIPGYDQLGEQEQQFAAKMRTIAHQAQFTPRQWKAFTKNWNALNAEQTATQQREQKLAETARDNAIRAEYPEYEQALATAEHVLRTLASPDDAKALIKMGILKSVAGMNFLNRKVAPIIREAEPLGGGDPPTNASITEAQQEIERIKADPGHPYWKDSHAGHSAAVKRVQTLREIVRRGQ